MIRIYSLLLVAVVVSATHLVVKRSDSLENKLHHLAHSIKAITHGPDSKAKVQTTHESFVQSCTKQMAGFDRRLAAKKKTVGQLATQIAHRKLPYSNANTARFAAKAASLLAEVKKTTAERTARLSKSNKAWRGYHSTLQKISSKKAPPKVASLLHTVHSVVHGELNDSYKAFSSLPFRELMNSKLNQAADYKVMIEKEKKNLAHKTKEKKLANLRIKRAEERAEYINLLGRKAELKLNCKQEKRNYKEDKANSDNLKQNLAALLKAVKKL